MVSRVLVKSTVSLFVLQAAKYIFPFIVIPYLTRVLGPDVFGIRAYMLATMSFVQIVAEFGFLNYGIYQIVHAKSDTLQESRIVSSILYAKIILLLVLAIVMTPIVLLTPILAENYIYAILSFASVSFTALLPDFVFRAYEEMSVITLRFAVCKAISTALTFVFVHSPADLLWIPALDLLSSLIAFIWSWIIVLKKYKMCLIRTTVRELLFDLRESSVYFASGACTIVMTSLTTYLMGIFNSDLSDIAYWGLAASVLNGAGAICGPLTGALYPNLMKRDNAELPSMFRKILLYPLPAVTLVAFSIALLRNPITIVLAGESYLPGAYVIALVSPMIVFEYYTAILGWPALGATGHVRELTKGTVLTMVVHLVVLCCMSVTNHFELYTVAIARVFSALVLLSLRFFYCRKCAVL